MLLSAPAGAESVSPEKRAAMLDLAREFVQKIDKGFNAADKYWLSLTGENPARQNYLDQYQDGEILLLQIKLPQNMTLNSTVMAEKQGRDLYISLSDFVSAARFPIGVRPQDGIAEGWFIRENRSFKLDNNNHSVIAAGKSYTIETGSVKIKDNDIWVRGRDLSLWLGFEMQINTNSQSMVVTPDTKWPLQEKFEREKRKDTVAYSRGAATKPRLDDPYEMAAVPNVDVFLNHRWRKNETQNGARTQSNSSYTVRSSGDVAGHTGTAIISGNDENILSSVRFKLQKESEDADLLGPLEASEYEIGDVTTTNIPLVGGAKSELGARVTNRNPYFSQNTQTTFSGYAVPGWDIELYRGQQFVAATTVGEDGYYQFDEVMLFAGENKFRVVQYGLQGEIEEQEFSQYVDASLHGNKSGVYDVSLTAKNTQTYLKDKRPDEDRGSPHLSALYETQATQDVILHGGVKLREEDGEQKAYAQAGTVANFKGVLVNADMAVDNDGAYTGSFSARKKIDDHNFGASARYTGKDYNVDNATGRDSILDLTGVVNGYLPILSSLNLKSSRYNLDAGYRKDGDRKTYTAGAGASARYENLNFNTSLDYRVEDDVADTERELRGRVGVRGRAFDTTWRATALADIRPDYEPREYNLQLTRKISDDLRGDVKVEYDAREHLTETELGMTWSGDHVLVSPTLTYDTDRNVKAYINARFGLAYDPVAKNFEMYGQQLTGRGGISALVFLDRDGDNVFSEGDEWIEDARVESVQSSRFGLTDENGKAFIPDLPTNRITDVVLNESSLPDPFWTAAMDGVSVRPRAGHTSRLEFPVHISGEIDGTVAMQKPSGGTTPLKNMRLYLYDETGKLHDTAYSAFDGFYLFTRVPPGDYLLMVDADDAKNREFNAPPPQKVTIGYEGTIAAGHDLVGSRDETGIAFDMASAEDFGADLARIDPKMLDGKRIILNLGDYNSQLLMALTWYNMRNRYGAILGDAKLLVPPSESLPSLASNKHIMRVTTDIMNVSDARLICRSLVARGFRCGVELLPDEFFTEISSMSAAAQGKS